MTFGDIFWSLIVFYFWFMIIWIFIRIFADIFHRNDLTGVMKVIWIIVLFVLPFLGALIYMLMRKPTEQDVQEMAQAQEMQKRAAGYSSAEEIAKLQALLGLRCHHPGRVRRREGKALA